MPDIGEKIAPVVEPLVEPGETLEGMCVGSPRPHRVARAQLTFLTKRYFGCGTIRM